VGAAATEKGHDKLVSSRLIYKC